MAIITGIVVWVLGLASVFSFNIWADLRPLGFISLFADKSIFGVLEYMVANILIPISGILIAIFAGWLIRSEAALDELGVAKGPLFQFWRLLLRFVTPAAVGYVLWNGI